MLYGIAIPSERKVGQDVAGVELDVDDDFSLLDDAFSLFLLSALVSLDSVFDSEVDFELVSLLASPFCPLRA